MGKEVNQVGGLKWPGNSRWSSHFKSICSLIKMYGATCLVLKNITLDGSTYSQCGDVVFSFKLLMSFDFAFILHIWRMLWELLMCFVKPCNKDLKTF
jgi:hypothetical protein